MINCSQFICVSTRQNIGLCEGRIGRKTGPRDFHNIPAYCRPVTAHGELAFHYLDSLGMIEYIKLIGTSQNNYGRAQKVRSSQAN